MADESQVTGKIIVETQEAQAAMAQFVAALQQTTSQMNQGFKQAADQTKQSTQQMQDSMKTASKGITDSIKDMHGQVTGSINSMISTVTKIGTAFVALGAILAGGKIFKDLIQDTMDFVSEAKKLSMTMGISINDAAAYNQAYKRVGINHSELEGVLKRFQIQVRTNSDLLKDKYGINIDEIRAKGGGLMEMFEKAKDVLKSYTVGFDRNMAAQEIFGRRVDDVNKILRVNADSVADAKKFLEGLGLTIGPEMESQIRKFKAGLVDIDTVFLALKFMLAQQIIPALIKMGNWMSGEGKDVIQGFKVTLELVGAVFAFIGKQIGIVIDQLNRLKGALPQGAGGGAGAMGGGGWGGEGGGEPAETGKTWKDTKGGGGKGGGEPSIIQQWQNELDQLKIANQAFQDQTLAMEKTFWANKLKTGRTATKEEEDELKSRQKESQMVRLQGEGDFWKGKLKECAEGTKEYNEVMHRIVTLEQQINKARLQSEIDLIKSKIEANKTGIKDQEALLEQQDKLGKLELQMKRENLNFEAQMGRISKADELREYKKLLAAEQAEDLKRLEQKRNFYAKDSREFEKHQRELDIIKKKHQADQNKLDHEITIESGKHWENLFSGMKSSFGSAISSMMQAGANFASVMASLGQSILQVFVNVIAEVVIEWVAGFVAALLGAKVNAALQIGALSGPLFMENLIALVPIVGPFAAPGVAGGLTAEEVSDALKMTAAEGGWWQVPSTTVTKLHPKEMVLPAWAAEGVRDLVGGGPGAGKRGGPITHVTNLTFVTPEGKTLGTHQIKQVIGEVKKHIRHKEIHIPTTRRR